MSKNAADFPCAFPSRFPHEVGGEVIMTGLTMLDWFAGQALIGMATVQRIGPEAAARDAYAFAAAMMVERKRHYE